MCGGKFLRYILIAFADAELSPKKIPQKRAFINVKKQNLFWARKRIGGRLKEDKRNV